MPSEVQGRSRRTDNVNNGAAEVMSFCTFRRCLGLALVLLVKQLDSFRHLTQENRSRSP